MAQPSTNTETPLPTRNVSTSIVFHKKMSILKIHLNMYLIVYQYILDQYQNSYRQRIHRLNHLHLHHQHHSKKNCLLIISSTTVLTHSFNVTRKTWFWKIEISVQTEKPLYVLLLCFIENMFSLIMNLLIWSKQVAVTNTLCWLLLCNYYLIILPTIMTLKIFISVHMLIC